MAKAKAVAVGDVAEDGITPVEEAPKEYSTVNGIQVCVTVGDLDDIEVVEGIADMNDPEADDNTKMVAMVKLFRRVFGAEYGRVKKDLRTRNGGQLSTECMAQFFSDVVESIGAKN